MLTPEARAAAHQIVAILLALMTALVEPASGAAPRPLLTRVLARLFAAYLRSISRQLEDLAGAAVDAAPVEQAPHHPGPLAACTKPRRPAVPFPRRPTRAAGRRASPQRAAPVTRRGIDPPPSRRKSAESTPRIVTSYSFRLRN